MRGRERRDVARVPGADPPHQPPIRDRAHHHPPGTTHRLEPLVDDPGQRREHRVDAVGFDHTEAVALAQQADPVDRVALIVGRIAMLRLHERDRQIQGAAWTDHPCELVHDLVGICDVLQHGVADDHVEEPVICWNSVQGRDEVDARAVQPLRDVLVVEAPVDERSDVAVACARVKHVALEQVAVWTELVLNRREDVRDHERRSDPSRQPRTCFTQAPSDRLHDRAASSNFPEERLSCSIRQSVQRVIPAAAPIGPAIGTV